MKARTIFFKVMAFLILAAGSAGLFYNHHRLYEARKQRIRTCHDRADKCDLVTNQVNADKAVIDCSECPECHLACVPGENCLTFQCAHANCTDSCIRTNRYEYMLEQQELLCVHAHTQLYCSEILSLPEGSTGSILGGLVVGYLAVAMLFIREDKPINRRARHRVRVVLPDVPPVNYQSFDTKEGIQDRVEGQDTTIEGELDEV